MMSSCEDSGSILSPLGLHLYDQITLKTVIFKNVLTIYNNALFTCSIFFYHALLQSSVSHSPLEIILIR